MVYGDPQILTARDGFSTRTINFVNECLTKEVADRPNFKMLMESSFYLYFQALPNKQIIIETYLEKLRNSDSTDFC